MSRSRYLTIAILAALAVSLTLSAGCGGTSTTQVLEANAAKGVKIAVGDQFSLVLDSNATTGFEWRLTEPKSKEIIKKIKNTYTETNTGAIGAGGKETWVFQGVKAGKVTIKMEYIRPWEPTAPPDKTLELKVTVTE